MQFHSVGQLVHHKRFDGRGVIFDVDEIFKGTEEWYQQMAISKPPKDEPWYHVLVDEALHTTYVAERNPEIDPSRTPINHPMIGEVFTGFKAGRDERVLN